MSVLIFGEKGFIASNLIRNLKKNKIKYKSFSKKKLNLLSKIDNDNTRKFNRIKKVNSIIIISAIAPAKDLEMLVKNIIIIKNIIVLIRKLRFKQIIYISSDAVYSDSHFSLKETSKRFPKNFHGQMHNAREEILKIFFEDKLCILRPSLLYGFDDTHNGYGPNKFYRDIKDKKKIFLFGNGEEKRDHVLIDDLIKTITLCIKKTTKGVFNISSGNLISFNKIANLLKNRYGKQTKIIKRKRTGPMPHNGYRPISNNKILKNFKNLTFSKFELGMSTYEKN